METLVYEDSPLADYLEGKGSEEQPQDNEDDSTTLNFAPKGLPTFQRRIRDKLPGPLQLKPLLPYQVSAKIREAFAFIFGTKFNDRENERFLEQFGYVIVASQLLNDPTTPSYSATSGTFPDANRQEIAHISGVASFDLRGAVVTAAASFVIVLVLHWARSRQVPWDIPSGLTLVILLTSVCVSFYSFARRQWMRYLRRHAVAAARVLVNNSQSFDSVVSASVIYTQEVELVSRGYRISTPLPPVSRLEEQGQSKRCMKLRKVLSACLLSALEQFVQAKRNLRRLADPAHLEKYYDICDFSTEELHHAESALAENPDEDKTSLRYLRDVFTKLYSARKATLCCLLALGAGSGGSGLNIWTTALEEMQQLAMNSGICLLRLTETLNDQDRDIIVSSPRNSMTSARGSLHGVASPAKEHHKAQLRRLNALSQGIRGLHAKLNLIREESDPNFNRESDESELTTTLSTMYDSVGADLRSLLHEWEIGRSSIQQSIGNGAKWSPRSSSIRSPSSTYSNLSGITAVDGGPASALRLLNGEEPQSPTSPDSQMDDEEVFEAVALPPIRKRSSLPRTERIARMKEDRAKHAVARERMDANTHMLRELQTVMKLRPRPRASPRTSI